VHLLPEGRQSHPRLRVLPLSSADGELADFEALYRSVGADLGKLPWAALAPRPQIVAWLNTLGLAAERRALVIGCGVGDDAEELGRRGYRVTAFDISPTAIRWCRTRFPRSSVKYVVADLLDLPAEWRQAFDVVVEFNTIQSIELGRRRDVLAAIAATVAQRGLLFVRAALRPDGAPAHTRPWPVSRAELADFAEFALQAVSFDVAPNRDTGHPGLVAVYTR
jgi:SAM-dependent methyltransferase